MFWDKTNRCSVCVCRSLRKLLRLLQKMHCLIKIPNVSVINTLQKPEWALVILCIFQIYAHHDPFLRSMAHWVLEDYSRALDTLLEQPTNSTGSGSAASKCESGRSTGLSFLLLYKNNIKMVLLSAV